MINHKKVWAGVECYWNGARKGPKFIAYVRQTKTLYHNEKLTNLSLSFISKFIGYIKQKHYNTMRNLQTLIPLSFLF